MFDHEIVDVDAVVVGVGGGVDEDDAEPGASRRCGPLRKGDESGGFLKQSQSCT